MNDQIKYDLPAIKNKTDVPSAARRLVFAVRSSLVNQTMATLVDKWQRELFDGLLPLQCLVCGRSQLDAAICAACREELPWNHRACPRCARPQVHAQVCATCLAHPPAYAAAWTPFLLEAPVQQHIHALKYHATFAPARALAQLMAAALAERLSQPAVAATVLIPVPLHFTRRWRRGYNQSLEIARVLSRQLDLRLRPNWARRLRRTADQIGMDAVARRRNLKNAFAVDARVAGQRVILLDDVMTTGATLNELARACRRAGAKEVEVWALARVP